ncbi:MAG: four helix bundle protein [Bacilli bacterium]|nr:four helix bundle protein [Bacilli bacterium]
MLQVSRDGNLKIPKITKVQLGDLNNKDDIYNTKVSIATANNEKIKKEKVMQESQRDSALEFTQKIPFNSSDLIVITKAKKLCSYVITITEKSPAKFRGVFVNRMQNYCLDVIELLLNSNFFRIDSIDNKKKREEYQKEAIIKLKMLGYISMISECSKCILPKQYRQISIQTAEIIKLIIAWKKSDDERFRKNH